MTALLVNSEQRFERYQQNVTWLRGHYVQLRKEHPDQFVAVNKGKVVQSEKQLESLLRVLRKKYDNETITTFAIEFVNTNEAELATLF